MVENMVSLQSTYQPLPEEELKNTDDYAAVLSYFGIKFTDLQNKLDAKQLALVESMLREWSLILKAFPENHELSQYAFINWTNVLANIDDAKRKEAYRLLFSNGTRLLEVTASRAESVMAWVYLGLNVFGLVTTLLLTQHVDLGGLDFITDSTTGMVANSSWNYIDSLGGFVLGIRQIRRGEYAMGTLNFIAGAQMTACTLAAVIATYAPHVEITAAAVSGLMGFSFAVGMAISYAIELLEIEKSKARIKALEMHLATLPLSSPERAIVKKSLLIEKAICADHKRSAKALLVGTIAMMALAIITYVALSGVSFGALPAATIVLASIALITAIIRKWWVMHVDHVSNAKESLATETDKPQSLFDRLHAAIDNQALGLDFTSEIDISGKFFFDHHKISLKAYLEELAIQNPKKLAEIVEALEQSDSIKFATVIKELGSDHVSLQIIHKITCNEIELLHLPSTPAE